MSARVERGAAGALAVATVAWWLLVPSYPNYDAYYHLVWGRELLDGLRPTFEAYAAPTQHPLYVAVAAILGLAGTVAERLLVLVALLSLVALVWGTWRLARALFGAWPAALAALFVGSSFAFLLYAVRAYVDVGFLALVLWAAVLEVERPGRFAAMGLLVAAGLLRPEAWLLAGLLWLWRAPAASTRERMLLAVAVVAAPALWALVDLAVTGDPLHSVRATSALAEDLGRERGLARVPRLFVVYLTDVARAPVAAAGVLGAVLALWRLGARRLAVPLALLGTGVLTYVGTGVAGLAILPRYLTVPAVALCVFAGYAVAGFTTLAPGGRGRTAWARGAAVAAVVGLAFFAWKLPSFGTLAGELRFGRDSHRDLVALLDVPAVRRGLRCGPLTFPTFRLVPDSRWLRDLPPERVGARSVRRPATGVAVVITGGKALERYGQAAGISRATNRVPPGFALVARRGRFAAHVACAGRLGT